MTNDIETVLGGFRLQGPFFGRPESLFSVGNVTQSTSRHASNQSFWYAASRKNTDRKIDLFGNVRHSFYHLYDIKNSIWPDQIHRGIGLNPLESRPFMSGIEIVEL